jgi:predicted aspartyl protease
VIYGVVSPRCEATLPVLIKNANGQQQMIDTVIDTGFNGFLTLLSSIITALDLSWQMSDIVTLGDGSKALLGIDVHYPDVREKSKVSLYIGRSIGRIMLYVFNTSAVRTR